MKSYSTPKLSVHGNVEAITQAFFPPRTKSDKVFIGASNVVDPIFSVGSDDGIIVPK